MKKLILITCAVFLIAINAFSQNQNNNWVLGVSDVNFAASQPTVSTLANSGQYGSASVSDSSGNLLFYTDGQTIWNKNHQVMQNFMANGPIVYNLESEQSAIIVPYPGNSNKYYVFFEISDNYIGGSFEYDTHYYKYVIVDFTTNPLGELQVLYTNQGGSTTYYFYSKEVTTGGSRIEGLYCRQGGLTFTKNYTDDGYWVLVNGRVDATTTGERIYALNVSTSGLSTTAVLSNFTSSFTSSLAERMVLKMSPDNTTLGVLESTDYVGNTSLLSEMSFNANTGQFSNQAAVSVSSAANFKANALEFSGDSQKIYLIKDQLLVKDLTTPTVYARTITTPTLSPATNLWHIQRDKYGHILLGGNGLNYLAKINNQNSYSTAVLGLNYVNLNNNLPNNVSFGISNTLPQLIPEFVGIPSDCPTLTLTSEPNTSNFVYSGYSKITANTNYSVTQAGLDIQMYAGDYVLLQPNTYIKTGSTFKAAITPCYLYKSSNDFSSDDSSSDDDQLTLENNGISLYPNPTNSVFTIGSKNQKMVGIEIYSIDGKLVYNDKLDATDSFNLDISSYSKGIYLVTIQTDKGERISRKLIKE